MHWLKPPCNRLVTFPSTYLVIRADIASGHIFFQVYFWSGLLQKIWDPLYKKVSVFQVGKQECHSVFGADRQRAGQHTGAVCLFHYCHLRRNSCTLTSSIIKLLALRNNLSTINPMSLSHCIISIPLLQNRTQINRLRSLKTKTVTSLQLASVHSPAKHLFFCLIYFPQASSYKRQHNNISSMSFL